MQLVFIYGPPAVGKLTVAKALSEATGFPLVDNHSINNPLARVFGWSHPERVRLAHQFRLELFEAAARGEFNLITTLGGGGVEYDDFIQKEKSIVEEAGGQVAFVRLVAPLEVLLERVEGNSRMNYEKMTTPDTLGPFIEGRPDVLARALIGEHLEIDSSKHSPEEMVKMIIEYYHLPTQTNHSS